MDDYVFVGNQICQGKIVKDQTVNKFLILIFLCGRLFP